MYENFYKLFYQAYSIHTQPPPLISQLYHSEIEKCWIESIKYNNFRQLTAYHQKLNFQPVSSLSDFIAVFQNLILTMPIELQKFFQTLIMFKYQSDKLNLTIDHFALFQVHTFEKCHETTTLDLKTNSPAKLMITSKNKQLSAKNSQLFLYSQQKVQCLVYLNFYEISEIVQSQISACLTAINYQYSLYLNDSVITPPDSQICQLVDENYLERLKMAQGRQKVSCFEYEIDTWVFWAFMILLIVFIVETCAFFGGIGVLVSLKKGLAAKGL